MNPPPPRIDLIKAGLLGGLAAALLRGEHPDLLAPLALCRNGSDLEAVAERAKGGSAEVQARRQRLAPVLLEQNLTWGHPEPEAALELFATPGTLVVITGQQAGVLGGPLYSVSKAVAAARYAQALEEAGHPAVALFWVATEDHDERECCRLVTPAGTCLDREGAADSLLPVGCCRVDTEWLTLALERQRAEWDSLPSGGAAALERLNELAAMHAEGPLYGDAFARVLLRILEPLGARCPLLVDSQLPELKREQTGVLSG